jgi:putative inorganic carbon (HCO3(-)) transporter
MGNPGIYGAVLGIGILASIGSFQHASSKGVRILLLASTLILLFGVLASYTRQAWISVSVTLFLAQFFISDLWKRFLPFFGAITLLLVIVWGSLAQSSLMESRVLDPHNVNIRIELVRSTWELFLENPLLGWGSGALNVMGLERVGISSHNMFLSLLIDGGLVLFLSFLIILAYLLLRTAQAFRRTTRRSLERSVLITASGFILIFLMSGIARELRYFGYFNAMFWICAGVIDRLGEGYAGTREPFEWTSTSIMLGDSEL